MGTGNEEEEDAVGRSPWAQAYAGAPDRYVLGTTPSLLARMAATLLTPGARVLDLGAGEGRDSVFFAGCGLEVVAVELSAEGIRKGQRLADEGGVIVQWRSGEMAGLELAGRFDLVYSCGSIHYLPREIRADLLRRLKDITRTGGYHAHGVFTARRVYVEKGEQIDYFVPGELTGTYVGWPVRRHWEDEIPCAADGVPHRHSVEWLIAGPRPRG